MSNSRVSIRVGIPEPIHQLMRIETVKTNQTIQQFITGLLCLYFGMDPNGEAVQVDPAGDKGGEAA